ncbi:hypothetical protein [Coraliomargarita akajimensis]|uniref:Uncharacterized protein n=1 Tax=Coraliomargarita akajimensis (strain DSM 45221 / IAM 15411 / JCM 23193 / KCTC 12865 / 04OKA010-24) TaxID=583355 RepID=D5EKZ3_CORAD|nr:hypothetical protein [Coraliomargarita akajimensis]ADE53095.1 hypothetical protein Caka_0066 [Coraliomargarita akajimensis DSM 45221]
MKASTAIGFAVIGLGIVIATAGTWIYQRSFGAFAASSPDAPVPLLTEARYPVEIVGAPEVPTVLTEARDYHGNATEIACSTCHSSRSPLPTQSGAELDSFHQGLVVQHGTISCLSCHNDENYDQLKLADGTTVEFSDAMQLCAQCHGPQYRDYQNGSHGGMNGYWDRSRGPRSRNACTVCHDAHAPAYPQLIPVFPPTDIVPPKGAPHAKH